jgi:hypothetical protein
MCMWFLLLIVMFTCYSVFTVNVPIISQMTLCLYIFINILNSCMINHIKAEFTPVFCRCAVHDYCKCWEWPWVCKRNRDFFVYVLSGCVRGREMPLPYGCTVWHSGRNPLNAELNPVCYLLVLLGAHPILHISKIRVKLNISQSHFRSGLLLLNLQSSLLSTKYMNCLI